MLSTAISYNGTTTGVTQASAGAPQSGIVIERLDISSVGVDAFFEKGALRDGVDAGDIYLGQRQVDILAAIYGSTQGDLFDKLYAFTRSFSPPYAVANAPVSLGFREFSFSRPTADTATWPTGVIPSIIYSRPMRPPSYQVIRDAIGGTASLGGQISVQATLVARDPRIYLSTAQTITITTSSQTATHRGTQASFPILSFTMSAAGSSAMMVAIDGFSVKLDLSTVTTGTYTVTYETRKIVRTSDDFLFNDLFLAGADQTFQLIQPGSASVVKGTNLTGISAISLTWTEAWL